MLPKSIQREIQIVSRFDPALNQIKFDNLIEYFRTYNMEHLGDIDSLAVKPTVFVCDTIRREFRRRIDMANPQMREVLFATHVNRVLNTDFEVRYNQQSDGSTIMHEDDIESFGPAIIDEVAKVIYDAANTDGVKIPFTLPDTFVLEMSKLRAQRIDT